MVFYKTHLFTTSDAVTRFVLAGTMLLASFTVGYSQTVGSPSGSQTGAKTQLNVQTEIAKVNSGVITPYGLYFLGDSKAKEAIPALEKQYTLTNDVIDKAQIAQVLVQLKDPNEMYWNYLVQLVTPVLDSNAPSPIGTDSNGKELPGVSPAFEAWVDANKLNPPTALQNATIIYPGYMVLLGETEDPRAIPLLRRALSSSNYLVAAQASEALALLNDEDAVPIIIDAAKRAPASAASTIAEPLGYFKSTEAQAALDQYVPKDRVQRLRERVKLGGRPLSP